jgi:hypothetical protein
MLRFCMSIKHAAWIRSTIRILAHFGDSVEGYFPVNPAISWESSAVLPPEIRNSPCASGRLCCLISRSVYHIRGRVHRNMLILIGYRAELPGHSDASLLYVYKTCCLDQEHDKDSGSFRGFGGGLLPSKSGHIPGVISSPAVGNPKLTVRQRSLVLPDLSQCLRTRVAGHPVLAWDDPTA